MGKVSVSIFPIGLFQRKTIQSKFFYRRKLNSRFPFTSIASHSIPSNQTDLLLQTHNGYLHRDNPNQKWHRQGRMWWYFTLRFSPAFKEHRWFHHQTCIPIIGSSSDATTRSRREDGNRDDVMAYTSNRRTRSTLQEEGVRCQGGGCVEGSVWIQ